MNSITPVLLLILDGFGHRVGGEDNAIASANTPNWDSLCAKYAYGTLDASEMAVGLPRHQFGNSEVGHLNIGAGRVVLQDITRIDLDIAQNKFAENPVIRQLISGAAAKSKTLHLIGLLSDGGVHSHEKHFYALIQAAHQAGVKRIRIHAFLDGRDTPPRSAAGYLQKLDALCQSLPDAKIASLCGRFWSMDRDQRTERIELAYRMLVEGAAEYHADDAASALDMAYQRGENDEFVKPTIIDKLGTIAEQDFVIFMNFRADRARQLTSALTDSNYQAFPLCQPKLSSFVSMTSYGANYQHAVAYPAQSIHNGFGEYLAQNGLAQLRIAETEKYPHVTYFFNGGEEGEYAGEQRIVIPSPKVATYDLQPQMSAVEVTDNVVSAISREKFAAIICNLANGDMVGHSGVFSAAVKAIESVDECIGRCVTAMLEHGGEVLITADHGNCEQMDDAQHNQPHTQHTLNPVPFLYIGRRAIIQSGGALQDISPSLLAIMGLTKPKEMTGHSLITWL